MIFQLSIAYIHLFLKSYLLTWWTRRKLLFHIVIDLWLCDFSPWKSEFNLTIKLAVNMLAFWAVKFSLPGSLYCYEQKCCWFLENALKGNQSFTIFLSSNNISFLGRGSLRSFYLLHVYPWNCALTFHLKNFYLWCYKVNEYCSCSKNSKANFLQLFPLLYVDWNVTVNFFCGMVSPKSWKGVHVEDGKKKRKQMMYVALKK